MDKLGFFKPYDLDIFEVKADAQENFPVIEMLIFSEKNFMY
jgi:hypothetical protein